MSTTIDTTTAPRTEINVIIWSNTEDNSRNLANKLSNKDSANGYWSFAEGENYTINLYVRNPSLINKVVPSGYTDCLVLEIQDDCLGLAKEYLETRQGIPFKFTLGVNEELAKELGCTYLDSDYSARTKVVSHPVEFDKALKSTFDKIDSIKNGSLDHSEIVAMSNELNHELTISDANEIIDTIGKHGKLTYYQFKHWWLMGRSDLTSFRGVIVMQMEVNKFLDNNMQHFSNYLDTISTQTPEDSILKEKISILPEKTEDSVDHHTAFNLHIRLGAEFDKYKESLPHYNEPLTIGLEISLKSNENQDNCKKIINTIESIKKLLAKLGLWEKVQGQGIILNTRTQVDSLFVELTLSGALGDFVSQTISKFRLEELKYSGHMDFHMSSKLKLGYLLSKEFFNIKDIQNEAVKINFEANGQYLNMAQLINYVIDAATNLVGGEIPKKLLPMVLFWKLSSAVRNFDFTFRYEPEIISEIIHDSIDRKKEERFNEDIARLKDKLSEGMNSMKSVIGEYLEVLDVINLDKISVFASSPLVKLYLNFILNIKGLNELVESYLFE